jgi:hypothetical protein
MNAEIISGKTVGLCNQVDKVGLFRVSGSEKRINAMLKSFETPPTYGKDLYT